MRRIKPYQRARRVFGASADKPRWAEENRPGERLSMRLSDKLIQEINDAARAADLTRTAWLIEIIEKALERNTSLAPPDFHERRADRQLLLRVPTHINDQIEKAANAAGLKKTEWVRRVAHRALLSKL